MKITIATPALLGVFASEEVEGQVIYTSSIVGVSGTNIKLSGIGNSVIELPLTVQGGLKTLPTVGQPIRFNADGLIIGVLLVPEAKPARNTGRTSPSFDQIAALRAAGSDRH